MSRRFWIGTPKGQNTTADTFFNTSNQTIYQVNTSAPTTYPSFFDTFYDTNVPTGYVISTSYSVNTSFTTSFTYPVITSHPTDITVSTQYYDPGTPTIYSQNTVTSYDTSYPTNVSTQIFYQEPVYRNTFAQKWTEFITQQPSYVDTLYSNPTAVPGFTTPTTYSVHTAITFPLSQTGCYYYNVDGSPAGNDDVVGGCTVVSCSPAGDNYSTASTPTYFSTCRSTSGTTTFLTHIFVGRNTTTSYIVNGQMDPDNEIYDCYPNSDPAVFAYCSSPAASCINCQIFVNSTFQTDIGYDRYTSSPAPITTCYDTSALTTVEYLSSSCLTCQLSCPGTRITSYQQATFYPPSSRITEYLVSTFYGYTPVTMVGLYNSYYNTVIGITGYYAPGTVVRVTSHPTSHITTTSYAVNTGGGPYPVNTIYTGVPTYYPTQYPTSQVTNRDTLYPTNVPTSIPTATPTSNQTSQDTTVITSWLTDNDVTTTYQTSRSTTWFTQ
jgi:hypothetical protein